MLYHNKLELTTSIYLHPSLIFWGKAGSQPLQLRGSALVGSILSPNILLGGSEHSSLLRNDKNYDRKFFIVQVPMICYKNFVNVKKRFELTCFKNRLAFLMILGRDLATVLIIRSELLPEINTATSRTQVYKTFYGRHLRVFVKSKSVCHWQAFPA